VAALQVSGCSTTADYLSELPLDLRATALNELIAARDEEAARLREHCSIRRTPLASKAGGGGCADAGLLCARANSFLRTRVLPTGARGAKQAGEKAEPDPAGDGKAPAHTEIEAPLLSRRAQPALVEHFFCTATVDMRGDQFFVSIGGLSVFVFAVLGPFLRQISLLDDVVAEQLLVG
jgi:hypothetical protein